ncbi:hypothetical protein BV898_03937 [Hypsibius exemplaris]|uniref:Uncharacterized protein n=1 Tax=Hypsibius exemplaris TaxID=2072580 RepID=A0A1W0X463_HYPEX|nr:hypothetical protein BV898_03937 [Hypsibius exemplaris]
MGEANGSLKFRNLVKNQEDTSMEKSFDVVVLAETARNLDKKTTTKRQVTDLLAELQPLRQRHQVQLDVLAREHAKLGSSASGSGDLEQQVEKFRAEVLDMEDKTVASQVQLQYLEVLEKRAQDAQGDEKFL